MNCELIEAVCYYPSQIAVLLLHCPRRDDCADILSQLSVIVEQADDLRTKALWECYTFDAYIESGECVLVHAHVYIILFMRVVLCVLVHACFRLPLQSCTVYT